MEDSGFTGTYVDASGNTQMFTTIPTNAPDYVGGTGVRAETRVEGSWREIRERVWIKGGPHGLGTPYRGTPCRGTWFMRNRVPLGPYCRTMPGALWWP